MMQLAEKLSFVRFYRRMFEILASAFKGLMSKRRSRSVIIPMPDSHGTCYLDASEYVRIHGGILVHGTIFSLRERGRIDHAWVEKKDGRIWNPSSRSTCSQEQWAIVQPQVEAKCTKDELTRLVVTSLHTGPWTQEERQKAQRAQKKLG